MDTVIWIQAIGSFFLFGATVFLVIANWKLVTGNRNLVNEVRVDREERMKPYIVARLLKIAGDYSLALTNLGGSPAFDIKLSYEHAFFPDGSIRMLRQKDEFLAFLGEVPNFPGEESFQVIIEYKDRLGNSYNDTFELELRDAWADKDNQLLFEIQQIGGSLDHIAGILGKDTK